FLSRVRALLVERGIPDRNVRVAWAEWRDPDVTSSVRHLAALGCRRVIVVPAVSPLDTLGTRLDLEISVRQARVSEGVTVVTLPAWKDDPAVIEELRAQVQRAIAEAEGNG
ncbi:MAG: ferrochelatase, partial [Actinobacteria bacterium]